MREKDIKINNKKTNKIQEIQKTQFKMKNHIKKIIMIENMYRVKIKETKNSGKKIIKINDIKEITMKKKIIKISNNI